MSARQRRRSPHGARIPARSQANQFCPNKTMRSSSTRDRKGEPQARCPSHPGRQDLGSTVTLVRLANRLSTTTKALSVCSAARPTTLSSQGTDRSFRPACAAASNSYGGGSWPAANSLSKGTAPTPAADDRAQPSAPNPPSAAVVASQAIAPLANPRSLPLISYPFCFYSMFNMLGAYSSPPFPFLPVSCISLSTASAKFVKSDKPTGLHRRRIARRPGKLFGDLSNILNSYQYFAESMRA